MAALTPPLEFNNTRKATSQESFFDKAGKDFALAGLSGLLWGILYSVCGILEIKDKNVGYIMGLFALATCFFIGKGFYSRHKAATVMAHMEPLFAQYDRLEKEIEQLEEKDMACRDRFYENEKPTEKQFEEHSYQGTLAEENIAEIRERMDEIDKKIGPYRYQRPLSQHEIVNAPQLPLPKEPKLAPPDQTEASKGSVWLWVGLLFSSFITLFCTPFGMWYFWMPVTMLIKGYQSEFAGFGMILAAGPILVGLVFHFIAVFYQRRLRHQKIGWSLFKEVMILQISVAVITFVLVYIIGPGGALAIY